MHICDKANNNCQCSILTGSLFGSYYRAFLVRLVLTTVSACERFNCDEVFLQVAAAT